MRGRVFQVLGRVEQLRSERRLLRELEHASPRLQWEILAASQRDESR